MFALITDTAARPFCGPSAIGLLTGVPLSRVETYLRRKRRGGYRDANGRRIPIRGTYKHEVLRALKHFGCKVTPISADGTLRSFVADVEACGPILVRVTGHYMTCERGLVYDAGHASGVPIAEYRRGTRRVVDAWRIAAPAVPMIEAVVERPKLAKPPRDLRAERRIKVEADFKRWTRKEKLARTKLKGLRRRLRYYERLDSGPGAVDNPAVI